MLIIGELINTSRKEVKLAVENKDRAFIQGLAKEQVKAGAAYLDINCGTQVFNEPEIMEWLVKVVQQVTDVPLCIDSPNPKAVETGLSLAKTPKPLVNSITAEKERFEQLLPLIQRYDAKVVALCMDDSGMPQTAKQRAKIVDKLVAKLSDSGLAREDIYLDPLVKPVSTEDRAGLEVLETIHYIKETYPGVHIICGLSNISYGLPNRKVLNQAFMIQTMAMGMDSYILNPLDRRMMGFIYASAVLLGKDSFCMQYLTAHRNGLYEGL